MQDSAATILPFDLHPGDVMEDAAGVRWTVREKTSHATVIVDRDPPLVSLRMTLPVRLIQP
jgi:hypothetical protein